MNAIIIFAKYPELSKVKTRLAKDIGKQKALKIYKILLNNTITKLTPKKNNANYKIYIAYTPINKKKEFQKIFPNIKLIPQTGKTLGERMHQIFKKILKKYKTWLIIGSDIPTINKTAINKTIKQLKNNDVVIGPAYDGGYYLIGMKKPINIFSNIHWSTKKVLQETINKTKQNKLTYYLISKKRDIDTIQDLNKYCAIINTPLIY